VHAGFPVFPSNHLKEASMAKEMTLNDLFYDTLKDIYFAERQILKALPKMARAAQSEQLKQGFQKHKEQTEGQIERLQQVFEIIGKRAQGKTCEAIQGIIAEGEEIIEEFKGTVALDAGLISSAQAVEHYEIARYGTLASWAKQLGYKDAVPLLEATLKEESQTDATLSKLAETAVNAAAQKKVA
jgi:ferritin-like metal-binding protein YciE